MANLARASANRHEDFISGITKRIPMLGGTAVTFYQGSFIGRGIAGYGLKMDDTVSSRFLGILGEGVRKEILAADANGANIFDVLQPRFITAKIADSITVANIGWPVFCKYDDEVTILNGTYGNFMGYIREIESATSVLIEPWYDRISPNWLGRRTLAATGTQTLLISDLGKTIIVPNTAPLTLNLPALATVPTGHGYRILKVGTTANAVTLDPDASETINGGATSAVLATNYECAEVTKMETGSGTYEWVLPTFS